MPQRLARILARNHLTKVLGLPIDIASFPVKQQCHVRHHRDPAFALDRACPCWPDKVRNTTRWRTAPFGGLSAPRRRRQHRSLRRSAWIAISRRELNTVACSGGPRYRPVASAMSPQLCPALVGYREALQTMPVPSHRDGELDEVAFVTNTRGRCSHQIGIHMSTETRRIDSPPFTPHRKKRIRTLPRNARGARAPRENWNAPRAAHSQRASDRSGDPANGALWTRGQSPRTSPGARYGCCATQTVMRQKRERQKKREEEENENGRRR